MIRIVLIAIVALLVIIQFFRPEKNSSNESRFDISTKYPVPDSIRQILKVACNDCHSNSTKYPWYAEIQPVAWWLNNHITHGKHHINFSDFTSSSVAVQNHRFEETIEVVDEKEMPLDSYTWLGMHPEAKITQSQKDQIISWAKAQMDTLKAHYPPDSLILKRH